MSLIAADGYEYEDLKARLLGEPLENVRNRAIRNIRALGRPEKFTRAWIEEYDARTDLDGFARLLRAVTAANAADPSGSRIGLATLVPPSPAPLHPAHQPPVPGRVGA